MASSLEVAIRILIDTKDGQSQLSALSDAFVKHLKSVEKSPQALRHLRASGAEWSCSQHFYANDVSILPPPRPKVNPKPTAKNLPAPPCGV